MVCKVYLQKKQEFKQYRVDGLGSPRIACLSLFMHKAPPLPPPHPQAHMHALANNRWIQSMTVLHSLITNSASHNRSFLGVYIKKLINCFWLLVRNLFCIVKFTSPSPHTSHIAYVEEKGP